jgi:hypothetical protein
MVFQSLLEISFVRGARSPTALRTICNEGWVTSHIYK